MISGNYRLGEFQGAVLNAQLDRLQDQTQIRDRNGQALARQITQLPGVYPQKRPAECTRHSYHLFMMRLNGAEFGAPRAAVVQALQAEGIPCSAGYGYSLPEQPMFRHKAFGPYLPRASATLQYAEARCPVSDLICREQGIWIEPSVFLGPPSDIVDVARALEKIYAHRGRLRDWAEDRKRNQPRLESRDTAKGTQIPNHASPRGPSAGSAPGKMT